jgi:hypothetical protein
MVNLLFFKHIVCSIYRDYEQGVKALQLLGAVNPVGIPLLMCFVTSPNLLPNPIWIDHIVSQAGKWTGGKALLVQLGDLCDRYNVLLK